MPFYPATYYKAANETPEYVKLEIAKDGLILHFGNGATETWPFSDCFAGQTGQGEAECIANKTNTDIRIFTRSDIITAVKAAIKGEPFKKPRKHLFPWGPFYCLGFWHSADSSGILCHNLSRCSVHCNKIDQSVNFHQTT